MLIGNAGSVTAISSLMLAFINSNNTHSLLISVTIVVVGTSLLWWAAQSEIADRYIINRASR